MPVRTLMSLGLSLLVLAVGLPLLNRVVESESSARSPAGSESVAGALARLDPAPAEPPTPNREVEGRLYQWRDARGRPVISTEPPPVGVRHESFPFHRTERKARRARAGPLASEELKQLIESPFSVYAPQGLETLERLLDRTADQLGRRQRLLEELQGQL